MADLFESKLRWVLAGARFEEVLRLAEPDVTELQRGDEVLSLQVENAGHSHRRVRVESESVDVRPLVGRAAKEVIVEVYEQTLGAMPWLDHSAARSEIDTCLARTLLK